MEGVVLREKKSHPPSGLPKLLVKDRAARTGWSSRPGSAALLGDADRAPRCSMEPAFRRRNAPSLLFLAFSFSLEERSVKMCKVHWRFRPQKHLELCSKGRSQQSPFTNRRSTCISCFSLRNVRKMASFFLFMSPASPPLSSVSPAALDVAASFLHISWPSFPILPLQTSPLSLG